MKYTQNFKIEQVTEKTLVVGVDIAKKKHYARAFDWRGIELDKVISFDVNNTGFSEFLSWVNNVADENGKTKIIVGIEPTGHYWYTFAQPLIEESILLVQVNPFHVKRSKELDDNTPSKSDRKDPKVIAKLVIDGRYQIPYIPKGIYAELRNLYVLRMDQVKKITSVKNKVIRWLDMHFPEFLEVFSSWEGKTALITLKTMCTPSKIIKKDAEEILSIWRKEVKSGVGIKKAQKLLECAKQSVGIQEGIESIEFEMKIIMDEYERIAMVIADIDEKLENLVLQVHGAKNIVKIKGIGIITVAGFFAEVGDITRFTHPKQIIKLAGLNLRENSSGAYKGKTTISKRGRSRLRTLLYKAMMPMLATNQEFKALHRYNTIERENPLQKMQSLIALCGKLIRVVYKMITQNIEYDGKKMMEDIHRSEVVKDAA